jgi:uncharacterized 2Fe-2S/4Fe-4S cluster protein (DUF4445 family)
MSKNKTYKISREVATIARSSKLQLPSGSVMAELVQAAEKQKGVEKALIHKGLQKLEKWRKQYPEMDVDKLEMLLKMAIGGF